MKYGIVNDNGKLIAIFKNEGDRDNCYEYVYTAINVGEYARVKVEDGVILAIKQ